MMLPLVSRYELTFFRYLLSTQLAQLSTGEKRLSLSLSHSISP